jgi:hypothetical protein
MYSEKLEKLISIALADGVLTDKGKQILMKTAEAEGIDSDEFEMVLEARLHEMQHQDNIKNEGGLPELLALLDETEQEEKRKLEQNIEKLLKRYGVSSNIKVIADIAGNIIGAVTGGVGSVVFNVAKSIFSGNDEAEIEEKIEELKGKTEEHLKLKQQQIISSFPLPASKDKILELLDYISLILKNGKKDFLEDVWKSKFHSIINLTKINFSNDKAFLAEIVIYERQQQRRKNTKIVIYAAIAVVCVIAAIFMGMWIYSAEQEHTKAKLVENARLEQILDNISEAIKNHNLDEAKIIATNQLIWKYESSWGSCNEEKETWDKKREEMLKSVGEQKHTEAKQVENARLEQILSNINEAIKNQNLDEAEILANQLVWKYESDWGNCKDEKKIWDKERKEILKTIHKMKNPDEKGLLDKVKDIFN